MFPSAFPPTHHLSLRAPACSLACSLAAGRQVFAAAMADGTMMNFFKLIEQYRTQVLLLGEAGLGSARIPVLGTPGNQG